MPQSSVKYDIADFPLKVRDTIRYADTDRQGHVNNAVFSTFFESGRVHTLSRPGAPLHGEGCSFVIAEITIAFQAELHWPGEADVYTGVTKIGSSSIHLAQLIYQGETRAATAHSVIVHVDPAKGKGVPLPDGARAALSKVMLGTSS